MSMRDSSRHSDLGPSSKDWQTGSTGRDEDFTPEKDLWTRAHKGDLGAGRPGEDIHAAGSSYGGRGSDIQPGTQHTGRSWQSHRPDYGNMDSKLDQALEDTFPTSDPPQPAQPGVTGWDLGNRSGREAARYGRPSDQRSTEHWDYARSGTPTWAWLGGIAAFLVGFTAARAMKQSRRHAPRHDDWTEDRRYLYQPASEQGRHSYRPAGEQDRSSARPGGEPYLRDYR